MALPSRGQAGRGVEGREHCAWRSSKRVRVTFLFELSGFIVSVAIQFNTCVYRDNIGAPFLRQLVPKSFLPSFLPHHSHFTLQTA